MSLSKANNLSPLFTGEINLYDTTRVEIPIEFIKQANIKFIERLYYIDMNNKKDSIIYLKSEYINHQNIIIKDLQNRIIDNYNTNKELSCKLNKQINRTKIAYYSLGIVTLSFIIGFILK